MVDGIRSWPADLTIDQGPDKKPDSRCFGLETSTHAIEYHGMFVTALVNRTGTICE